MLGEISFCCRSKRFYNIFGLVCFSLLLQSLEGELSRHQLCPNLVSPKLYSQGLWFPTNLVVWLLLLRTYSEDAVHPGVTFIAVLFMDNNQHEDYFT